MLAPTIVYDLDGTLADTAEDLVATLNWLLGREGLAPIKVESAGSLVGVPEALRLRVSALFRGRNRLKFPRGSARLVRRHGFGALRSSRRG